MSFIKYIVSVCLIGISFSATGQETSTPSEPYKKRVLENKEIDILTSFYSQEGDNAAVTGGIGTEELTDFTLTYILSIPLNDDDVLTIDAGISAYSSASSSNVDPFDGDAPPDAFQASSGASSGDVWLNVTGSYSHSSDDRNNVWSANASISREYDYLSFGFGGAYTRLFNQKNTEVSIHANAYLDSWTALYPFELRPFTSGDDGLANELFNNNTISGNTAYNPSFTELESTGRNTYAAGIGFSQILHKNVQASLAIDFVQQQGLLSTPFQRVYFADVADSFIEDFHIADDIERLPDSRTKLALGGRLNWYLNESVSLRTFYRYYSDDWGIDSHTASIEVPLKISNKFTIYPSYRFYNQTAADHFRPYETAQSTEQYYTSDYDLSGYSANQYGMGVSYTDIFTKARLGKWGLKSIDIKYYQYDRNSSLSSSMITIGAKFIVD